MRVVGGVGVGGLSRWQYAGEEAAGPDYESLGGPCPRHPTTPFPADSNLNSKLILWQGDISLLEVEAISNSSNETLDELNIISERILSRAGSGLKEELLLDIRECRTGDVKVTSGHQLPARYIIHTVGPQYSPKYHTAAESTLHTCYRNIIFKACELGVSTLAICLVHSVRRNFPADLGVHIALRTVRRYLERATGSVQCIVLCAAAGCDASLLEALAPLYFPRGPAEERLACYQLPLDTGGSLGEPLLPDRQIRIIDNPQHTVMDADDDSVELEGLGGGFGQMQGDLDRERLLGERRATLDPLIEVRARQIEHQERYERLLRRAKTEDLSEISGIGCLYQSGVDKLGRPVVVFTGKWFPFSNMNLDKALLYLVYLLDPIVKGDYVIAYFHTLTSTANYPSFSWLKEVYSILPYKYKKNLKAFYIVHPTIWTKMMTWWFTTFMAPAIKQKVHNLPGVEYLYSVMDRDQLEIPAYITEYDMTINGLHYFQPFSNIS